MTAARERVSRFVEADQQNAWPFIDGVRTVTEIRDAVSAEFEPIDIKAVSEYLDLLARIGAISLK